MQLARVIGNVVASRKEESLKGVKLMIVQKVNDQNQPQGSPFIAIDATHQAGEGDLVFLESGREAALGLEAWYNPADQAILGIVDQVHTVN
ncbi:ethanolamine utilization protein EutN [bacterium (Candidatus Blackallbacteria) CG17_big_fil_post_rev_8_21_14_2_50_48_46]|uniref:Ethanolamine utilization protein EutN n=1 Tax=bacterium (Candidatus Blackallbacteria) CG17_big_fil_post_rev_8_21_14_2_50_48_46 TaxID=2014261 RepID=A0A2M7G0B7_9BACT|nr:MAG: ethanolamine utilization protein EutN [bacterium (Candidatus Blackallbacteria) CG18_big_fil_WC_8_21_14_2_50_49_26]PIW15077.1 MAG: ethanolamine utilization protein EutN [bacterium (Candidatus Blackallbacteria) CG17_big_fil_post_rev_8_21_14_2_50_48_46]PIW47600.1 MAG: ethanolamine utilization protein EutN [bacterium (Candidatus Blackallbacteria) CG13_big_fil_rev_8_21_14_2_50_49_14]